jgi:hypothetical protein
MSRVWFSGLGLTEDGAENFENVGYVPEGEFSYILALKTCRKKLKFLEHFTLYMYPDTPGFMM